MEILSAKFHCKADLGAIIALQSGREMYSEDNVGD